MSACYFVCASSLLAALFSWATTMTTMLRTISLQTVGRWRHALCHSQSNCRLLSSKASDGSPLILWLESETPSTKLAPNIIMPPMDLSTKITVSSPQQVVQAVDEHYSLSDDSQQFVGGMGESDAGVWFASSSDPLEQYPLMQESIRSVKEFRHGVPFGTFTSGVNLPTDLPPLQEIGLARIQVSLLASNPKDYAKATGISDSEAAKYFGQVCGFCVTIAETGFPLEVSVLQEYASSARDLAVSLGAVEVHVF